MISTQEYGRSRPDGRATEPRGKKVALHIEYFYRTEFLENNPGNQQERTEIVELLTKLRAAGKIQDYSMQDSDAVFPDKEAEQPLFNTLNEFTRIHRIGLGKTFGSNKHRFCNIPAHFVLVKDGDALTEVFPCKIHRKTVEPIEYLESLLDGKPWTKQSGRGMKGNVHEELVQEILSDTARLEPGLTFEGQDVQVSLGTAEAGYIDLYFTDRNGAPLLIEVKARWQNDELLKALGQILYYRDLFVQQNRIDRSSVRMAIVCPSIPKAFQATCRALAIECFEVAFEENEYS